MPISTRHMDAEEEAEQQHQPVIQQLKYGQQIDRFMPPLR